MKLSLPNAVTTRFARQVLIAQKNSPQLLFVGGLALMGGTVVSACRGTLKLEAALDDIRMDRRDLNTRFERPDVDMTDAEVKKMNMYITVRGAARVARLYTPSLIMGSLAVAALTSSHNQLTRRNAGLSVALAATDRALRDYRERVSDAYGEEKELELYQGVKTESHPVIDEEGRETKSKKRVKTGGGKSPYAVLWGADTSTEYDKNSDYNLAKLRSVQEYLTLMLNKRGHVFLNDAFDELGLPRTSAGAVVGWLSNKNGGADGYVDLGVLKQGEEVAWLDFARGLENHIWLDPNVDGEIWRLI